MTETNIADVYGSGEGDFGPTAEITVAGGLETTVFPIPVTIEFKDKGVATKAVGFELSDLVINGGTASDFTKVTDSKYTVNIYPSDIPQVLPFVCQQKVFWGIRRACW